MRRWSTSRIHRPIWGRNAEGDLIVDLHAADLVRMAMAAPGIQARVGEAAIDGNGDGLPDTARAVEAVFRDMWAHGVATSRGEQAVAPVDVPTVLAQVDEARQATALRVRIGSFTNGDIIVPAQDVLDAAAADLAAAAPALTRVGVSGEVITQFESLESFSRSMLISLPIAIALTLLIAGMMLRSARYAVAAVIPIGFVVTGVYAFMFVAGYQINVVTATIAAIAVGVGIDFSTHFVARYREELSETADRLEAVRQAGVGTGGALALSALTSVLGFTVMAFAPTPIFSTFGTLTAVMIGLALATSLLVLPAVVVAFTRERTLSTKPLSATRVPAESRN